MGDTFRSTARYVKKASISGFAISMECFLLWKKMYGVSFENAKEVFLDPLHISKLNHRFGYFEERWITLDSTTEDKILVVANMFFDDDGREIIRIISTRKANQKERIFYEQH